MRRGDIVCCASAATDHWSAPTHATRLASARARGSRIIRLPLHKGTSGCEIVRQWPCDCPSQCFRERATTLVAYPAQRPLFSLFVGLLRVDSGVGRPLFVPLLSAADSTDRRNGLIEPFSRCFVVECFSWTLIESARDRIELGLRVGREVNALGQILPE